MQGPVPVPGNQPLDFPSTDDTAAIVTLAAEPGVIHLIDTIDFGYSDTPNAGLLTVTSGGTPIWKAFVGWVGTRSKPFPEGLKGRRGEEIVITLSPGGAGVLGALYVHVR